MAKNQAHKSIDLGALQDGYQVSKRSFELETRNLVKAQEAFDRAKRSYQDAREALQAASRTVLA